MSSPDLAADPVVRDRLHLVARRPATAPAPATAGTASRTVARGDRPDVHEPVVGPPARRTRRGTAGTPAGDPGAGRPWPDEVVRWLPLRPPEEVPEPVDADVDDVEDVVTRRRAEALASAAAGYTATHGHPLDHPREDGDDRPAAARWHLTRHQALVAGAAVLLLAAGVVVRAVTGMPAAPVSLGAALPGTSTTTTPATTPHPLTGMPTTAGDDPSVAAAEPAGNAAAGVAAAVTGADAAGSSGAQPPAGGVPAAGAPVVVVHVVGRVTTPGVLTLPAGSRVADAVAAAGGAAPEADLTAVNLARPLVDGEQVRVPAPGDPVGPAPAPAAAPAGGPDAAGGGTAASPVALNTADVAALDALPGIGPVLAGRIVDWRTQNGPFRSVDELGEVAGIGEALLLRLRPLVRV